jgi:hypothetical protein
VRKRFGQWILDTCRAEYDENWLAYLDAPHEARWCRRLWATPAELRDVVGEVGADV